MISKILKKLPVGMLLAQTLLSLALILGMHGKVMAQCNPTTGVGCATSSFNVGDYLTTTGQKQDYLQTGNPIGSFIIQIVNFLSFMIGSLCFLAIVVGGFFLLTSHGNENQLTKGKGIIQYAVIGLVVVFMAYYITAFVQSIFYEVPGK
jgi:hypothetical protein